MTSIDDLELPLIDVLGSDRETVLGAFDQARSQHWLARTPLGYAVMNHGDVTALMRDRRFHSAMSMLPAMAGIEGPVRDRQQRSILAREGDDHNRLRRLASPAFTPRATDRLRPFMRQVIHDLIDAVASAGRCEFVTDICEPYPIPIICELLGAPKQDWKLFSGWATDIFRMFNNDVADDLAAIEMAMSELDSYVAAMIDHRRRQPADDLLTRLIEVEEQGDRLTRAELTMMAEAVLMAGTDTTRNQLACAVALFASHPDQWRALGQNPELAPQAVEEAMRHLGAVRSTLRVASEDIDFHDVTFPAGTLVMVGLAAANHDPTHWADPYTFDISRPAAGAPQMTFGSGIHFCLGASLARAELQEAFSALAQRMPDLGIDGTVDWKPPTVGIWGPQRLPIRFRSSPV